eukprot:5461442-Amphidinium_carterae.1
MSTNAEAAQYLVQVPPCKSFSDLQCFGAWKRLLDTMLQACSSADEVEQLKKRCKKIHAPINDLLIACKLVL